MEDELIGIIRAELDIDIPFEPDTPLLSSGIINSFQVVHLLAVIHEHYGVTIDPVKIGVDNFDTIEHICEYLESRSKAANRTSDHTG